MGEISEEAPCSRGCVRRQALKPWMVMVPTEGVGWLCSLSAFPFLSISPPPLSISRWGWRQAAHSSCPRSSLLSARGSVGAQRNSFSCHFIPDSVCCYDVSGIGSSGCVAMESVCAFYRQIERCVSKSCSLTVQT